MTTITVPRAVLERALEALEKITAFPKNFWDLKEEITALRDALPCTYKCEAWPECACAALAQQEQEPVAWQWLNTAHFRKKLPANAESGAWNPLYTHPPLREPEQEPKAWMLTDDSGMRFVSVDRPHPDFVPLYTAPPCREWRSLSEEEINETLDNNLEGGTSLFDICRAIEQALKEKNT
jgi:hypothetical protein